MRNNEYQLGGADFGLILFVLTAVWLFVTQGITK